ncbi:class I SAM-dependent methyltransferase [Arcanobacterium pinnipediorum]|uniref:Class I SAM-dependent methyltransferase n=1 Tax=Arcanobacterium pinnipediorum TaxID=1503041 RepID=A0ABY5AHT2_9ACTO|nr:class I SAM-dependent methyltransferase [Arcanobacterium pinnipediorum]USR79021.1 class I SAM-dependent methyltransferase [Arcanobacterium pinnipediorum]
MPSDELYLQWKREEDIAHIEGWDFSHIEGRYTEDTDLPWDFSQVIGKYLDDSMMLLDMETGGGEFLLSLQHPHERTAAIEGYEPNVEYCRKVLSPLGIDFRQADGSDTLPFGNNVFDVVTNRHGDYSVSEIKRVLKSGGYFITQQVGAENDRELIELLLPENKELPFPQQYLGMRETELQDNGFEIVESAQAFSPIRFYDVGALVWFAKIIEWEFAGFSVDRCLDGLRKAQEMIARDGFVAARTHRYYMVARKK